MLHTLTKTAQILDKTQILCSRTHTFTVKMVFVFPLGILPRLKPLSLPHSLTNILSFPSWTDCRKGRGFPASLLSSFYCISKFSMNSVINASWAENNENEMPASLKGSVLTLQSCLQVLFEKLFSYFCSEFLGWCDLLQAAWFLKYQVSLCVVSGLDSALLYVLSANKSENGTSKFVWQRTGYVGPQSRIH